MKVEKAQQFVAVPRVSLAPFRKRTIILGTGQLASSLHRILTSSYVSPYEVVGFVSRDGVGVESSSMGSNIIGAFEQLFEIVERHNINFVAVCLDDRRAVLPIYTLLDFKSLGIEVVDGHTLYEQESGRFSIDSLKPSSLVFSSGFRRRFITMTVKRLIDVCAAFVGLILLAPVFIVIGALIRLDSPGPVFYRQMRVGLGAHPYMIWKFRTMGKDAEKAGPRWAQTKDPRISRVGRWLRKLRIDELPQLINVLKGEMSLVGPRPERPVFVQELRESIPYYDLRHTVRPGITGWAQAKFRYCASADDTHVKLQYDLYYVKNLGMILDLRILIETVRVVLLGEGAR